MSDNYELPNVSDDTTPEQAGQLLNKVHAEIAANKQHPYMNKGHFQNKDFTSAIARLHEIKAQPQIEDAEARGYTPGSEIEKAMADALDLKVERQSKLVEEAQMEMAALEELGFDPAEVPDDIRPDQVRLLKAQRLIAEKKIPDALPIIEKELRDLRDFDTIEILRNFRATPVFDETFMQEAIKKALFRISSLNDKKYKGTK